MVRQPFEEARLLPANVFEEGALRALARFSILEAPHGDPRVGLEVRKWNASLTAFEHRVAVGPDIATNVRAGQRVGEFPRRWRSVSPAAGARDESECCDGDAHHRRVSLHRWCIRSAFLAMMFFWISVAPAPIDVYRCHE